MTICKSLIVINDLYLVGQDLHNAGLGDCVLYKEKNDKQWYQLPDQAYFHPEIETYILKVKNLKTIEAYINKYISAFENNQLRSCNNYYSYEKHFELAEEIWGDSFVDFGRNFAICSDDETEHSQHLRSIEFLLSLNKLGYININEMYLKNHRIRSTEVYGGTAVRENYIRKLISLNVHFNKSPAEITDIHKYWISYGDLRANEQDGVAHYKNVCYPFKSTTGKAFKLLCFLIKNHGKYIPIIEATTFLEESETKLSKQVIKERIKGYIKEIKENLQINKDPKPSLDIKVVGEDIILISNPL